MSAAEHQSSNSSQPAQSAGKSLKQPPRRPSLRQPPSRSQETSSEAAAPTTKPTPPVVKPPVEDAKESVDASQPTNTNDVKEDVKEATSKPKPALHPISPPSERMQYRAIGLVRGTYTPSEEQLNRGCLVTEEGTLVDSVLLGRVTSLVKKYIDLSTSHLWVVYPRTRQVDEETNGKTDEESDSADEEGVSRETDLHLQIVGVWEPETLGMPGENPDANSDFQEESGEKVGEESTPSVNPESTVDVETPSAEIEASDTEATTSSRDADPSDPELTDPEVTTADVPPSDPVVTETEVTTSDPLPSDTTATEEVEPPLDNYFSIRGEILDYDEDASQILVKILQAAKRSDKGQKAFRLHITGQISGRTIGYFWELDIERQGKQLVLVDGRPIGIVPPKKKKRKKFAPGGKGRRPHQGPRHQQNAPHPKSKPRVRPSAPVKSNPL